jgi:hypothetical protein
MGDEYMAAIEWLWCDNRPGVPLVIRPPTDVVAFAPDDPTTARYRLPPLPPPAWMDPSVRVGGAEPLSPLQLFTAWMAGGFFVGSLLGFIAYMNI